jgi:exopolysaccharide biosynthesis polyprenyl glycosylphosphotransferase
VGVAGIGEVSADKVVDITRGRFVNDLAISLTAAAMENRAGTRISRTARRILLMISGQTGASLLSLGTLAGVLAYYSLTVGWILQPLAALAIIRTWYFHTRGPEPVLTRYRIRRRVRRLVVDEGKMAVVFLGVCFVAAWPLTVTTALAFVAANFVLQFCLMGLSRLVIKRLAQYDREAGRANAMAFKAIIVGTGDYAKVIADKVCDSPEMDTSLLGFLDFNRQGYWRYRDIPLLGHPENLASIVANSQVDALFWAVEPEEISRSWKLMETAESMGVRVFVMSSVYQPKFARVRPTYINGLPAMVYRSEPESPLPLLCKKIIDKLGALAGLLLAAPVMALIAAVVKFDSRGPVLFRQTRLGLNGRPFKMLKFRTMCCDAETRMPELMHKNEMSGPVFKIKQDPRVTRVGKFLRRYSLDELPQFLNVLRGEMSLVGPRPPLPQEVRRFEPWQHRKLSVTPGLTCLWQVNGRNSIDFEDWVRLDLQYIDNWSLWLDAKIIAKTVPAVFKGSGQ